MKTVIEATKALESIISAPPAKGLRKPGKMKLLDRIHQGDVYLCKVEEDHPRGNMTGTKQIAVGTTIGSRHVVSGDVSVFAGKDLPHDMRVPIGMQAEILGPVVVVGAEGCELTHPEHDHHELSEGVYQVTYQMDMKTRLRVAD